MAEGSSNSSQVRIAHLSDIHFYEASDGQVRGYRHSPSCLKRIEEQLAAQQDLDLLIVTGDITNIGDKLSLERAYQWIDDQIYIDGEYYGLHMRKRGVPVIAVPGNHDAFNAPTHGSTHHRWQSSLKNFHSTFHAQVFQDTEYSVGYRWIQNGKTMVFLVYVDSCFLGDHESEKLPGFLTLGRIAKGKFSRRQTETIMKLYDEGIRGNLTDTAGNRIPTGLFLASLKVLAMHHYLFEPVQWHQEPLLDFDDKKTVFQNLAMSDFDVLLCGHKHMADFCVLRYIDHFDPRGKIRLAHNVVRRSVGLSSLPLKRDEEGRSLARMVRFVYGFLTLKFGRGQPLTDDNVSGIIDILRRSLENKAVLKNELLSYLEERVDTQCGLFDEAEVRALHSRIRSQFSRDERKRIAAAASSLGGLVAKLGGRPFAHVMSGSSGKANETSSRRRGFNVYSISNNEALSRYDFSSERYAWNEGANSHDGSRGTFNGTQSESAHFGHSRIHTTVEQTASADGVPADAEPLAVQT
jgi:3',5'-cyclic AMP phosphodiesterase CpdA